jgi:hypothetical protein
MSHEQPYKCESEEIFQERLAKLQEYMNEANIDGIMDIYCPTSPVLYHVTANKIYVVDSNRSNDPSQFSKTIADILHLIRMEKIEDFPEIHYL